MPLVPERNEQKRGGGGILLGRSAAAGAPLALRLASLLAFRGCVHSAPFSPPLLLSDVPVAFKSMKY